MRKLLTAALLLVTMTVTACMGGPGPQAAPEPSGEQVERAVKKALHDDEMKDVIKQEARTTAGIEALEQALDSKEGQKAVQDSVRKTMNSPIGRSVMQEELSKMMEDPQFKAAVQSAIRQTLMEMMAKGGEGQQKGGGKGGGGGQGGGGGGGSGGGGDGGGGGGGGGEGGGS